MNKLILKYLKRYASLVCAVIALTVAQVYSELLLPEIMAKIVDIGLVNLDMPYIYKRGAVMLLVALLQISTMLTIGFISAKISSAFAKDVRRDIFVKAQSFSLTDLNRFTVSSMIVRNTNDVTVVQNYVVMLMRMVLSVPVLCIGSIFAAFRIHTELSLVILGAIPLLGLFFTVIVLLVSHLFVVYREKLDNLNLLIREHLSGTRVIRAFVNQETEKRKFTAGNEEIYRISLRINRILSAMRPGMMFIVNLATFMLCYFGIIHIENGTVTVGELMSLISYFTMILMSLSMLSFLMVILPRTKVSAKRIKEVLDTEVKIKDPPGIKECSEQKKSSYGEEKAATCGVSVEFKNVSFSYPDSSEKVIDSVSFVAESGKTTAIIGSTGSGKSTLQRLIIRLYDVNSGAVLLNGKDVRDYSLTELRDKVGYIPQKAVLFSGTVADNIRYGYTEATDEEIEQALKVSQAWDFVSSLDGGISAGVSQGGKNFSGGQKQRLAIARAIIKPCGVMVFDDSFSALDYATDAKLRSALNADELLKNRTKIIIAQRISTVMNADKIIVLNSGRLEAEGTHKELLKKCVLYREIARSQLSEEELE